MYRLDYSWHVVDALSSFYKLYQGTNTFLSKIIWLLKTSYRKTVNP